MNTRRLSVSALSLVALAVLSGCAAEAAPASSSSGTEADGTAADSVTITDAWVKTAAEGMTAGFGSLENTSDVDANVVSVETTAASMSELHETVEDESGAMVMRPIDGGFTIPASGALTLEPAGNHLMLMDLAEPLHAGDEVPFTLEFSDGSELAFTAVVKDYAGANENYVGDDMDMDMGDDE